MVVRAIAAPRTGSDAAVARMLRRFARAEAGSALTMRWAAAQTVDPDRKVLYLRHALDEERHARAFEARARELGRPADHAPIDAEDLFARLGETSFLAFVALAETRGLREFASYRRALERRGDDRSAAIFRAIGEDETRHATYARALLGAATTRPRLRLALVALWETHRSARRGGALVGRALYAGLVFLLWVLVVPALWLIHRRREPARLA